MFLPLIIDSAHAHYEESIDNWPVPDFPISHPFIFFLRTLAKAFSSYFKKNSSSYGLNVQLDLHDTQSTLSRLPVMQ